MLTTTKINADNYCDEIDDPSSWPTIPAISYCTVTDDDRQGVPAGKVL
jgi:hypothetical protein